MSIIKKIGRFFPVDDKGYIINDSHINNIQPVFLEVIQEVKDICFHLLQDNLHSIYIRGSVPRGIGILSFLEPLGDWMIKEANQYLKNNQLNRL